jgi:hypothetical protein
MVNMESNDKVMEKCSTDNRRETLFSKLDDVIDLSHKKVTAERGNADSAKQAWSRVLISAIATYGNILKDSELDDLKAEIEAIKEDIKHERSTT